MHCAKGAEVRLLRVDGGGHGGHVARPAQRRMPSLVKVDVLRPSHSVEMGLHGGDGCIWSLPKTDYSLPKVL